MSEEEGQEEREQMYVCIFVYIVNSNISILKKFVFKTNVFKQFKLKLRRIEMKHNDNNEQVVMKWYSAGIRNR